MQQQNHLCVYIRYNNVCMTYKSYIFDLYGTLLDIHTDETKPLLWKTMADLYACYGADYTPDEMKDAYHYVCMSEQTRIQKASGSLYSEINLDTVFLRLLIEAPHTHASIHKPDGWGREDALHWTYHTASVFRSLSCDYCHPYEDTLSTLKQLKEKGCRLFILSDAQAVFTYPELERNGLMNLFDDIWLSSQKQLRKPAPGFLGGLINEYHLKKKHTVLIGNSYETDIQSAYDHQIDSYFMNTDQLPGYERRKRLNRIRHDGTYMPRVIYHLSDLLKIND